MKGRPNYLQCNNNNYTKLKAFSELLWYIRRINKIIELINFHKIYALCDLAAKNIYWVVKLKLMSYGLEYYLNERSFNDKYYDMLRILGLTEDDNQVMIRETLYNYNDSNKKLAKDLISIGFV